MKEVRELEDRGKKLLFPNIRNFWELFIRADKVDDPVKFTKEDEDILVTWGVDTGSHSTTMHLSSLLFFSPTSGVYLDVMPAPFVIKGVQESLLLIEGRVNFKIVLRDDGTALVTVEYQSIIGSRWLALIDASTIPWLTAKNMPFLPEEEEEEEEEEAEEAEEEEEEEAEAEEAEEPEDDEKGDEPEPVEVETIEHSEYGTLRRLQLSTEETIKLAQAVGLRLDRYTHRVRDCGEGNAADVAITTKLDELKESMSSSARILLRRLFFIDRTGAHTYKPSTIEEWQWQRQIQEVFSDGRATMLQKLGEMLLDRRKGYTILHEGKPWPLRVPGVVSRNIEFYCTKRNKPEIFVGNYVRVWINVDNARTREPIWVRCEGPWEGDGDDQLQGVIYSLPVDRDFSIDERISFNVSEIDDVLSVFGEPSRSTLIIDPETAAKHIIYLYELTQSEKLSFTQALDIFVLLSDRERQNVAYAATSAPETEENDRRIKEANGR